MGSNKGKDKVNKAQAFVIDFVTQSFNEQLPLTPTQLDSTSGLLAPSWAERGRGHEHAVDDKVDSASSY